MSPPDTDATPLARWFARHGDVTQVELAARLTKRAGEPVSQASVSQWSSGDAVPRASVQLALSEETGGEVSPLAWTHWEARRDRPDLRVKSRKSA